jgi:hypothetical protein
VRGSRPGSAVGRWGRPTSGQERPAGVLSRLRQWRARFRRLGRSPSLTRYGPSQSPFSARRLSNRSAGGSSCVGGGDRMGREDRCDSRRRLRLWAPLARATGGKAKFEPTRYLWDLTNRRGPMGFSGFCMSELSGPENQAAMTRFVMCRMSDRRGPVLGEKRIEQPTERLLDWGVIHANLSEIRP